MIYKEAEEYLFTRLPMYQRVGAPALKPNLDNTYKLLSALENPHHDFKSVHIAGTNGKGSSAHSIASILQSAGYHTGLYTSPHLKKFTERIKIDGSEISESAIIEFIEKHHELIEEIQPSFFEITVAMAFDHFRNESVDIAVIEVGLGGRLDSTNVIQPEVSLITMIGWDHANILGDSLKKIALEKAGIIKSGAPVVIGADQPALLPIFVDKAKELNTTLHLSNQISVNQVIGETSSGTHQLDFDKTIRSLNLDIDGVYYLKNIPGIIKTILTLREKGWNILDKAIIEGLENVTAFTGLKGRWQILNRHPLIIADVGHNEDGITQLLNQVLQIDHKNLHVIYGTVDDKDVQKILQLFPRKNTTYYLTSAAVLRAMSAMKLQTLAAENGIFGNRYEDVNEALTSAKKVASKDDIILICGSTFVVAEIENL